jgi:predicted transcriptional regulator
MSWGNDTDREVLAGEQLLRTLLGRHELVECLERAPMNKPELVAACEVSRSTVDRGIAALEDRGIVHRRQGRHELTLFGAAVDSVFRAAHDRLSRLAVVEDLLGAVDDEVGLDAASLTDAVVRRGDGSSVLTMLEAFDGADRLRVVDPPFPLPLVALSSEEGRLSAETTMLLRPEVVDELTTLLPDAVSRFEAAGGRLGALERPATVPVALVERGTARELCLLLGSGETGFATVTVTDPAAFEWGEKLFDSLDLATDPTEGVATDVGAEDSVD